MVRDAPAGHPFLERTAEPPRVMLQGLMEILRNKRLRPILALNFCSYACTFTVQGLWGGPFLREVHGMSAIAAGNVLLGAVITYQFGMLAFGPLDRLLDTRKWIAISGNLVTISMLATLALASHPPVWVPVAAILVMGFVSAASTMVLSHGRGIIPDRLIGRGMSTLNTAVMLGVACMQSLSGVILGAFEPLANGARTEAAYHALFGVLTVVLIDGGCDLQPLAGRPAERRNARAPAGAGRLRSGGRRFDIRTKKSPPDTLRLRHPARFVPEGVPTPLNFYLKTKPPQPRTGYRRAGRADSMVGY